MPTITLKVNQSKYDEIKAFYSNFVLNGALGDYVDYIAKTNGVTVTGYISKKETKKVTFAGENPLNEALIWDVTAVLPEKKQSMIPTEWVDIEEQIGSDEVGVGDLFLPMIVVAAYVKRDQIKKLKQLGVTDSKKLTDEKIREIGPKLIKEFEYSKLTLSNKKYNEMLEKGENINSLKAKMHNRALSNLREKYPDIYRIYVDEFVNEMKFYSYLTKKDEPIVREISFKTKGESYFPSVALASVIARYAFLLEKDKLDKEYGLEFPFGASKKAEEFLEKLKEKLPKEAIDDLVKINFRNYK